MNLKLKILLISLALFLLIPTGVKPKKELVVEPPQLNNDIRTFLESKESPLAPHTDLLLEQKHWKLLIAISAIESQYCKRQLGYNCWGIGGDSAYRHYESIPEAIVDANNLIEKWQQKGRWLTPEDMNCSYVVPCNPVWVEVVNRDLKILNEYEQRS